MKKNILYTVVVVLILGIAGVAYVKIKPDTRHPQNQTPFDGRNSTFKIENTPITLVNGISETKLASISNATITTRYFGNEIKHDLNNDGRDDAVFLVTQQSGGSGTFFYVVAVLDTPNGFIGSDSFFLGDRISPQSTNIDEGTTSRNTKRDNVIVVNYAVRGPSEPMITSPSIGKSVWLKLDPATLQFAEVAQNFSGN